MSKQSTSASTSGSSAATSGGYVVSGGATRWLAGLTVAAIGFWVLLGLHVLPLSGGRTGGPGTDTDSTAGIGPTHSPSMEAVQGPWGRLEYVPITISPPLELVPQATSSSPNEIAWHFPNTLSARLPALLSEIGLSEGLREKLVSLAEIDSGTDGLVIRPTPQIVRGLTPKDRSALYAVLSTYRQNSCQRSAFRFWGGSFDEWIGDSPLAPQTRKLVEPLVYRDGSLLFFADLQLIERSLPSPQQRSELVRALSHEPTFLIRLQLSEQSDLEELVDYWGRGGRTREVRPILESLYEAGGEQSIDITYLLPPFARRRIYTYHVASDDEARYYRDCHWSSLNFFAERPDDRFGNVREVTRALHEDYRLIDGNLRLGDVVAFIDQKTLIHTAVYVAADVLFTKNGRGSSTPWMLMKLEEMQDYYPRRRELLIQYYRRKDL